MSADITCILKLTQQTKNGPVFIVLGTLLHLFSVPHQLESHRGCCLSHFSHHPEPFRWKMCNEGKYRADEEKKPRAISSSFVEGLENFDYRRFVAFEGFKIVSKSTNTNRIKSVNFSSERHWN